MINIGKIVKIINLKDPSKFYLRKVSQNKILFEDHNKNIIMNQEIIGKQYGLIVSNYFITKPTLNDFILYYWKRKTQIVYPKDSFYIISKMQLDNSCRVLEIATGSGVMTLLLSKSVYPNGQVFTIEKNYEFIKNSIKNILDYDMTFQTNYLSLIKFFLANNLNFLISKCINFFDSVFIDIPYPENLIDQIYLVLRDYGCLICILPTTNQVSVFLKSIQNRFIDIEVEEIILRRYKTNPDRLRPQDIMTAHTTYIISAKKLPSIWEID